MWTDEQYEKLSHTPVKKPFRFIPKNELEREAFDRVMSNPKMSHDEKWAIVKGWRDFERRTDAGLANWHYLHPEQPIEPEPVSMERVDRKLQEQDAVIIHLENRLNGVLKMSHTHSKKVSKGTY